MYCYPNHPQAVAHIKGGADAAELSGQVRFYQGRESVLVVAEVSGLPQGTGKCDSPIFAFHIHGGGNCEGNGKDAFAEAGAHYNPKDCPHPYHAGDLPPLFGAGGKAFSVCLTDRFTVSDIIGKTVIIHASADDFTTRPSGNAGEKIACGVITPTIRFA